MIEVRKKEGESPTALIFRFSKRVKQSGVMKEAKSRRFLSRAKTKRARRLSAQHRDTKRKDMERSRRMGLL